MQFGASIFFTDYSISPAELAVALEERGFDSLWVAEHSHIPVPRRTPAPGGGELPKRYYDVMDPFVTLGVAAAVTKRLKLGTGVCLVIQRDTIQTAKLVASIDQVSGGRFLFGIGGGWNAEEIENHGTEFASRFKKMREQIEAMKEIWTKSEAEYHGDLAESGAETASAGHPWRRLSVGGAPGHSLRRRMVPERQQRQSARIPAPLSPDGRGGRARSAVFRGHSGRCAGGPGYAEALSRPWCRAGKFSGASGKG
jgi:probable F420-dependent oxidoreductase